jgi:hypothetical protein
MKEGWVLVYTADSEFKARIADDVLKQYGIESLVAGKPDSAIPSIGSAELYVPAEKAAEARRILKEREIDGAEE